MSTIIEYRLTQVATLALSCTLQLALFLPYLHHSRKTFDSMDVCEFLLSHLYSCLLDLLNAWRKTTDSPF